MIVSLLVTASLLGFVLAAAVWVDAAATPGKQPVTIRTPDRLR